MNNADLIVATLKAAGIARGFGIPSGNVLPLMEAMRKGGVDFVLTAHEGSAGFAAPGTFVLAMVFLTAFVLYYFINWKYLSTLWGLS